MEWWKSWAIAIVGAAAIYYYYFEHNKPKANKPRSASVSEAAPPQPKAARRRDSTRAKPKSDAVKATGAAPVPALSVQSGEDSASARASETGKKRKAPKKQLVSPSPSPSPAPAHKRQELDDDVAQEEDNKAWAQQLASLKKGTSLAPPARTDSRNKTVKQSAATFSSASSNAADADDDLTPAMSPSLAAGDVSDMLEPTPGGPSVLRLTASSKPGQAKQTRQQTPTQVQETKKQRQNRKKIEERKLQREAEERERQALLESQRRTAREARGEPAKNGIPVSKPPTTSAWAEQIANRATAPPATVANGDNAPLLDTFDRSGPSEEDQLNTAKEIAEDDSGWNTVPKGKKQQKKKNTAVGSEDSNTSDAGSVHNAVIEKPVSMPPPSVSAPKTKTTTVSANGFASLYDSGYDAGSHPDDSQWAA